MKAADVENRRRIQHLLAMTGPVQDEVTFFRDCRPQRIVRGTHTATRTTKPTVSPQRTERVLRTVVMPHDEVDALKARVATLEAQLKAAHDLAAERELAWSNERARLERTFAQQHAADMQAKQAAIQAATEARTQFVQATQDYMRKMASAEQSTRQTAAEKQQLVAKLQHSEDRMQNVQAAAKAEAEAAHDRAHHAAVEARRTAHAAVAAARDDSATARAQFEKLAAASAESAARSKQECARWKKKAAASEMLRKRQMEGFQADMASLQRAVRQLELQFALVGDTMAVQAVIGSDLPADARLDAPTAAAVDRARALVLTPAQRAVSKQARAGRSPAACQKVGRPDVYSYRPSVASRGSSARASAPVPSMQPPEVTAARANSLRKPASTATRKRTSKTARPPAAFADSSDVLTTGSITESTSKRQSEEPSSSSGPAAGAAGARRHGTAPHPAATADAMDASAMQAYESMRAFQERVSHLQQTVQGLGLAVELPM